MCALWEASRKVCGMRREEGGKEQLVGTVRGNRQWGGPSGALKTDSTQGEKFTLEATGKS